MNQKKILAVAGVLLVVPFLSLAASPLFQRLKAQVADGSSVTCGRPIRVTIDQPDEFTILKKGVNYEKVVAWEVGFERSTTERSMVCGFVAEFFLMRMKDKKLVGQIRGSASISREIEIDEEPVIEGERGWAVAELVRPKIMQAPAGEYEIKIRLKDIKGKIIPGLTGLSDTFQIIEGDEPKQQPPGPGEEGEIGNGGLGGDGSGATWRDLIRQIKQLINKAINLLK